MRKFKIFISSVQKELTSEREAIETHLKNDPLLSGFFEPILFERMAAKNDAPERIYIDQVVQSDIYIGLLGSEYGYEDGEGISPTEREYDAATQKGIYRLAFIKGDNQLKRVDKEQSFIRKIQNDLSYKRFNAIDELIHQINGACVDFLKERGIIGFVHFDESTHPSASLGDIDLLKIESFIEIAKKTRGFPLPSTSKIEKVLTHLHLLQNGMPTNSALLLFAKDPQCFFPAAIIKCAHFHGTEVQKPIPDHKVFAGDVFAQIDQAVDFVLTKLSTSVGVRHESTQAPISYEIPREVIAEAIINAVVHRDYYSQASVQVMVFADRVEVFNPGKLAPELSLSKLREEHGSYPPNPRLAEAMYQTGYIERFGTGTGEIYRLCQESGLEEPRFELNEGFKIILYRPGKYRASTGQVPGKYRASSSEVEELIKEVKGEMKAKEIQEALGLKHRDHFRETYLNPSLGEGFLEAMEKSPNSPKQRYRLTEKGKKLQQEIKEGK